jgi:hypothetical protein
MDDVNEVFYGENPLTDLDESIKSVKASSLTLTALLRSTAFRRINHQEQSREVAAFIEQAERDANLRGAEISAKVQYGYVSELGQYQYLFTVDVQDLVIGGVCLGVDTLESFTLVQAIRKDANLIDKYAGICLILDPNADTRQRLNLKVEQVLYLPFGQDIKVADSEEKLLSRLRSESNLA